MPPVIVAEQLSEWYGPRLAVDRVSLEVAAGEVMGLLGPNGSGKTTILRILTGYLRPSAGAARIAGLDVVHDSLAARARVGYVPEDAPLYGWMRVREFLVFMARLKGLSRQAAPGAVERVVERLALGACIRRVPGVLGVRAEREPGADLASYFVDVASVPTAEALAAATVAGGFGLHEIGPAPVDLEALFLGLTSGGPEAAA